jgi:hypothetical protein
MIGTRPTVAHGRVESFPDDPDDPAPAASSLSQMTSSRLVILSVEAVYPVM